MFVGVFMVCVGSGGRGEYRRFVNGGDSNPVDLLPIKTITCEPRNYQWTLKGEGGDRYEQN